jgi:SAM-dependent methyltransferase
MIDFWTVLARSDGSRTAAVPAADPASAEQQDRKHQVELGWWQWWLGAHGLGARTDYYREFMLNMGGLTDPSFFDGLICLDIGCGPMGSLTWLPNAKAALGLDPLAEEYRQFGIAEHDMVYLRAHAEDIPLPSGSVDVVFSMNSLDHVDDLPAVCRETRRVLKPGGWFIGSLNLHEPATDAEPWTLTEELLQEHLFHGWTREFYRVRPKVAEAGREYRYFFEECPQEIAEAEGPRALWCRFRIPV